MLDWSDSPEPSTVAAIWARLRRLIPTIPDRVTLTALPDGSPITVPAGTLLVPHGVRGRIPKAAVAWPVGTAASSAVVTTGAIDSRFVRLYSTAETDVNVEVML